MTGYSPPLTMITRAAETGRYKANLPVWNILLRGFMSGAFVAMGGALATVCSTGIIAAEPALRFGMASPGFAQMVMGMVFPLGIILTVITGVELFTGDVMLAPMASFVHGMAWSKVLNLWLFAYMGNFAGAITFAYIVANGPFVVIDASGAGTVTSFGMRAIEIATLKTSYVGVSGLWSAILKGIACNWLVNLAILLAFFSEDLTGKIIGIWFPIMAFVACGFEHCIANMYYISAGIFTQGYLGDHGSLTWTSLWMNNVIWVTIGNIIGGLFFVSIFFWIAYQNEVQPVT
ncbi:MAG: formate transporter [Methanomicrobiales archaeon HGW-Methanomicrobiales-1]|nr:MAG: formate transporter [Methanomicrobiales archaeon HGW-Methanomicrobiales-1]